MLFLIINGRYLDSLLVNIIFYFSNYNKIWQQKTSKIFWFFLETNARVLEMRGRIYDQSGFFKRDPMINCHRGVHLREGKEAFFSFFPLREHRRNTKRRTWMSDERKIPTCKWDSWANALLEKILTTGSKESTFDDRQASQGRNKRRLTTKEI